MRDNLHNQHQPLSSHALPGPPEPAVDDAALAFTCSQEFQEVLGAKQLVLTSCARISSAPSALPFCLGSPGLGLLYLQDRPIASSLMPLALSPALLAWHHADELLGAHHVPGGTGASQRHDTCTRGGHSPLPTHSMLGLLKLALMTR